MEKRLKKIYRDLYGCFGPQGWWPGDSPFEVIVGAVLTQNTAWQNVEKAIRNLKKSRRLSFKKMRALSQKQLSKLIRPAGYYNVKAKRLKNLLELIFRRFGGDLGKMRKTGTLELRRELLSVNGVGPETADSILLYAFEKPVFVIDAYTRRLLTRHGLADEKASYEDLQDLFMKNMPADQSLFNEYHALIVRLAKEYCRKSKEKCPSCPLNADKN